MTCSGAGLRRQMILPLTPGKHRSQSGDLGGAKTCQRISRPLPGQQTETQGEQIRPLVGRDLAQVELDPGERMPLREPQRVPPHQEVRNPCVQDDEKEVHGREDAEP